MSDYVDIKEMTVAALVEHLQTLPQDLVVVELWDEAATYSSKQFFPKVKEIVKSSSPLSYRGKEWTDDDNEGAEIYERRKVVVI